MRNIVLSWRLFPPSNVTFLPSTDSLLVLYSIKWNKLSRGETICPQQTTMQKWF